MRLLILGGGNISLHFLNLVSKLGGSAVCLTDFGTTYKSIPNVEFNNLDNFCSKAVGKCAIFDALVLFRCRVNPRGPVNEGSYVEDQVSEYIEVLSRIHDYADWRSCLMVSSASVYGTRDCVQSVSEDIFCEPHSQYGRFKLMLEQSIKKIFCGNGLIIVRPSSIYGVKLVDPRSVGWIGRLLKARIERKKISINGIQWRDFLSVDDFVLGLWRILLKVQDVSTHHNSPTCLNVGGVEPVCLNTLAEQIGVLDNASVSSRIVESSCLDSSKCLTMIGEFRESSVVTDLETYFEASREMF